MRRLAAAAICACLAFTACPPPTEPPLPDAGPQTIHTTYRMIGGVSMGAIGSMALATTHPDQVDGVTSLGGPLDGAFFQRFMDRFVTSGFCSREALETILRDDPVKLNDPAVINACAQVATPSGYEHPNDFNHWHVTNSGGSFDRDSYIELMTDLMLAYGNFFTNNAASPIAPPGIDPEMLRHPPADLCAHPLKVSGLRNAEYNPDGTYDAITFCDGDNTLYRCKADKSPVDFCSDAANVASPLPIAQEAAFADAFCASKGGAEAINDDADTLYWLAHAGQVDACRQHRKAVPILLAFDYNGNGRRDYGEPVLNNAHERWDDVGADGCSNAFENGSGGCNPTAAANPTDANHDDYDVDSNPNGTEQDWRYESGEPFRDFGLDGVANTQDEGEGNGRFDEVEGRKRLFALDGRSNLKALGKASKRFNVLVDGGIYDIFNLGLMAKHLFGQVRALRDGLVGEYRDFTEIPGMKDRSSGQFAPWNRAWKNVPRDLFTFYGKDQRTDAEIALGEGDHVGTAGEAINRFTTIFNWIPAAWPNAPMPEARGSSSEARYVTEYFDSQKLGAKWEYSVSLPPGYDDPENANAKYPVAYLLHGYGMEPAGFLGAAVIANSYVTDATIKLRPVIYVFPNGKCCYTNTVTGARDCRNSNDEGKAINTLPDWERECFSGTFWVNRKGYTPDDGTAYGDAMFELMEHIDTKYRTLPAAEVEAR